MASASVVAQQQQQQHRLERRDPLDSSSPQQQQQQTVYFDSPSHSDSLLGGLERLRAAGHLLDVTLYAQDCAFGAHRAVLAACSDYFRAMFTTGAMLESRLGEIRLNGVPAAGMRPLLDYAYTARLALNAGNVQDVLSAASHVQVGAAVEACENYLQARLDLDNCVDVATIAETYSLRRLRSKAYRFMSARVGELARSDELYRLSAAQLERLLACDYPVDCAEAQLLEMALRWLRRRDDAPCAQRLAHWARFLRRVRFAELSERDVEAALRASFAGAAAGVDRRLYQRLLRDACRQASLAPVVNNKATRSSPADSSAPPPLINSRGMEMAVVKVGGFGLGGVTNEITYFLPSKGKWKRLTTIPHVEQCNFGTAVWQNKLYAVGGCFNQSLQEYIHPFGFCYSPLTNKWATMAPMQRERCRFTLTVVGDFIYAVGGISEVEGGEEGESACERYDPKNDSWRSVRPLPEGRTQHAGCSTPSSELLISGGLSCERVLSSVLRYDASADSWQPLSPLPTPRADHAMLCIGDRVYACGGWFDDPDYGQRVLADTIDAYDCALDRWETVARVPTPRYHAGIVAVGSKIYLMGGFHNDAMFDRATAVIECYDVEADAWTTAENYPQDIWEHACVTLHVPKCRDDMDILADAKDLRELMPNC